MYVSVGERIKKIRSSRGFSQERLAKTINMEFGTKINKGMVSKWENNKEMPNSENMYRLTQVLDCDLSYIMGFESSNDANLGNVSTSELIEYVDKNKEKLSSINKEDSLRLIRLIDSFVE